MGAMQCCMDRDKTEEGIIQKPQAAPKAPAHPPPASRERWADVPTPLEDMSEVKDSDGKPEQPMAKGQATSASSRTNGTEKPKAKSEKPEKRVDPTDGRAYTFEQMQRYYKGVYSKRDIQNYWDSCPLLR